MTEPLLLGFLAAATARLDHWREGGTYWLIEHELRPALAEFVRARRELLLVS